MGKYSLVNVSGRMNGKVSGTWLQDVTGSVEEAIERARSTERANGNRIEVAVVDRIEGSTPRYNHLTNLEEIVSGK